MKVVCSPTHVRGDGSFRNSLFPPGHIENTGVSLIRQAHIDQNGMKRLAEAIGKTVKDRAVAGVATCSALEVREVVDDKQARLLCVVDDPVLDLGELSNEAHAIGIASAPMSRDEVLRIQKLLLNLFRGLRAIDEIYAS